MCFSCISSHLCCEALFLTQRASARDKMSSSALALSVGCRGIIEGVWRTGDAEWCRSVRRRMEMGEGGREHPFALSRDGPDGRLQERFPTTVALCECNAAITGAFTVLGSGGGGGQNNDQQPGHGAAFGMGP